MGLVIGLRRPVLAKEGLYANFNIENQKGCRSIIEPCFFGKINLNLIFIQRINVLQDAQMKYKITINF